MFFPRRNAGSALTSRACNRSLSSLCASSQSSVNVDSRWRTPSLSRYRIHQSFESSRLNKTPSCLLGLAISHLMSELGAEGLEIRLEKSDVAAHHAEMGNLLSLYPKIHC